MTVAERAASCSDNGAHRVDLAIEKVGGRDQGRRGGEPQC
jgi:hypothetical protein